MSGSPRQIDSAGVGESTGNDRRARTAGNAGHLSPPQTCRALSPYGKPNGFVADALALLERAFRAVKPNEVALKILSEVITNQSCELTLEPKSPLPAG